MKCDKCINAKTIIDEEKGRHSVCILIHDLAKACKKGDYDGYQTLENLHKEKKNEQKS